MFVRPVGLSVVYTAGCIADEFLKSVVNLWKTME